jgi:uncharacterized membrane protein YbhN (UPF0104 family)
MATELWLAGHFDPSRVRGASPVTVCQTQIDESPIDTQGDSAGPGPSPEYPGESGPPAGRRMRPRLRTGVTVVIVAAVAYVSYGKREGLGKSVARLGHSHVSWIPIAVLLESVSMATFAFMQQRLVRAGGKRVGIRPMLATTYAANALSVSVPLAGPELGTAFTYRRLKAQGVGGSLATWSLLVGGLVSWVGAVVVLVAGGALSGNAAVTGAAVGGGVLTVAAGAGVRAVVRRPRLPLRLECATTWVIQRVARFLSHPIEDPHETIRVWRKGLQALRLPEMEWGKVGGLGLVNWLADAGVLAISLLAPIPWHTLLLVYGLATVVGSLGITPGGIGLVEGTLCLGLVSTGLPAALALAAVLLYRLVSFWLVMVAGWLVLLYLRLEQPARALSIQGRVAS